jgi:phosphoribosylanthranilate isomerase
VILAGGLRSENVAAAIAAVAPYAVDASTGVEGKYGKDAEKVNGLIDAVKRADLS